MSSSQQYISFTATSAFLPIPRLSRKYDYYRTLKSFLYDIHENYLWHSLSVQKKKVLQFLCITLPKVGGTMNFIDRKTCSALPQTAWCCEVLETGFRSSLGSRCVEESLSSSFTAFRLSNNSSINSNNSAVPSAASGNSLSV